MHGLTGGIPPDHGMEYLAKCTIDQGMQCNVLDSQDEFRSRKSCALRVILIGFIICLEFRKKPYKKALVHYFCPTEACKNRAVLVQGLLLNML